MIYLYTVLYTYLLYLCIKISLVTVLDKCNKSSIMTSIYKDVLIHHLLAKSGSQGSMTALMLIQMIRPHEGFATKLANKLLDSSVDSFVA